MVEERKPDFSGYATKAGLKCSDGLTILPNAFEHQHTHRVPLVWQHGHSDPENVLGHCILENRPDGVYTYGFFNDSKKAKHTAGLLEHGDINMLSIWANQLIKRAGTVIHGAIREVSLVLAGANPGAVIESVTIRHSDDTVETLEDEGIIYTDIPLEHASSLEFEEAVKESNEDDDELEPNAEEVKHADDTEDDDETIEDVYNTLTDKQKEVVHFMIGQALESAGSTAAQSALVHSEDATIKEIYDSMTDQQKDVLHFMIGEALEQAGNDDTAGHGATNQEGNNTMGHNVFEQQKDGSSKSILSHDEMKTLLASAFTSKSSLKEVVEQYAKDHLEHGITDIDLLFPEARNVTDVPEWVSRRMEWVGDFLSATRKSPFSRIKTLSADLTHEDARAKGYIKGSMKKDEFFSIARRITVPTTVYKKQSLDRDDVIDITDFDVVAWLKTEMRIMLDEELARAAMFGDGRDPSSEDKISETSIRPIAKDNELYTTTVTVNVGDSNSSMNEVVDALMMNRFKLKGTGVPTFYTTEYWIGRFLTLRDGQDRRMYKNLAELALELRVRDIVPVEPMADDPTMIGIIVNPVDYVFGADRGGQVSMFDDFDIDYNKQKYLIETRASGALVKIKSAMVVYATTGTNVLAVPASPTFDPDTGALTIVNTTGVVYKNSAGATVNAAGSPYTVDPGESETITATPAAGYYFATSDDDTWVFTANY